MWYRVCGGGEQDKPLFLCAPFWHTGSYYCRRSGSSSGSKPHCPCVPYWHTGCYYYLRVVVVAATSRSAERINIIKHNHVQKEHMQSAPSP